MKFWELPSGKRVILSSNTSFFHRKLIESIPGKGSNMTPCDYFDLAFLLFLVFGTLWCFAKGFIASLTMLLAPAFGFFSALRFQYSLLELLDQEPSRPMLLFSWFVLFAVSTFIVYRVMNFMEFFINKWNLKSWNHLLGLVFGSILTVLSGWIAAYGLTEFQQTRSAVTESRSAKYLVEIAECVSHSIPENTKETPYHTLPEKFMQRVEEDVQNPSSSIQKLDENSKICRFLNRIDEWFKPLLLTEDSSS